MGEGECGNSGERSGYFESDEESLCAQYSKIRKGKDQPGRTGNKG
jgi:hypothetical protein